MTHRRLLVVSAGVWMLSLSVVGGKQSGMPAVTDMTGKILTVNGPIDPAQLGHTLMHEHVFIDFTVPDDDPDKWRLAGRTRPLGATAVRLYSLPLTMDILGAVTLGAPNRDNWLLDDEVTAVSEVAAFKRAGGNAIVDTTSIGLKRRPEALRRVSRATGVNIVMGSSWYTKAWHPAGLDRRSIESLTDEIVRDISIGVDGTTVRAGIIGEVGTSADPADAVESRIIRASGRASRLTGASVSLHTLGMLKQHAKVLDLLESEGTDLSRVVVGHSDFLAGDLPYLTALLQRGVTIEFDLLGKPPVITRKRPTDLDVARTIVDLIKAGHASRVLLSQDICTKTSLKAYGGTGYAFIAETFIPYLKRQGVTDAQINEMVVENPKRLLTFVAPQPSKATSLERARE